MPHTKHLKEKVERLLREDRRCREDVNWLTLKVFKEIAAQHGQRIFIPYDKQTWEAFPPFESVARCRRDIMNKEGKFNDDFMN